MPIHLRVQTLMIVIAAIGISLVHPELAALFAVISVPSGAAAYLANRLFGPLKQRHLEMIWLGVGVLALIVIMFLAWRSPSLSPPIPPSLTPI